jgi:hypothetical protein
MTRAARARVWLLFAVAFLLPFGSLPELPLLIAAVIGSVDAWRSRAWMFGRSQGRLLAWLFAAYWLPELVSAFDSVAPAKSWLEVAADLRFLPFGWFVLCTLREAPSRALLLHASALLLMLWVTDALVQSAFGVGIASAAFSATTISSSARCWLRWRRWHCGRHGRAGHGAAQCLRACRSPRRYCSPARAPHG